jgi:deoxyxylulose-5-phosphate synthase
LVPRSLRDALPIWARPSLTLGIPDRFIAHGSRDDCLVQAELDPASLATAVERWWTPLAGTLARSGT